MNKMK